MRFRSPFATAVAAAVSAVMFFAAFQPIEAVAVTIDLVTVNNPGNASDPGTGYGRVDYQYQIGKYHVTIGQYAEFLNAVAKDDRYSLYNTSMGTDNNISGISRSGTSGNYSYTVLAASGIAPFGGVSAANRPITYVSWFDAARFANWISNGQPSGAQSSATTENGAYNLNGATSGTAPARNVTNPNTGDTPWFGIPNENEWYKAAFYSPALNSGSGGYYTWATQSNVSPNNMLPAVPGSTSNEANFYAYQYANPWVGFAVTRAGALGNSGNLYANPNQNFLTDVGAFTNSSSYYGTFDQSGNVYQWNDLDGTANDQRGIRGGWFYDANPYYLSKNFRYLPDSTGDEANNIGFRVVTVPEPSTYVMVLAGLACGGYSLFLHRRAR
jgi:formylglycine-generating enzyme required for sulfatase activity